MDLRNSRIGEDTFHALRTDVLNQWPTGRDVIFDAAVQYQQSLPEDKNFCAKLSAAKSENRTLIQPRAGTTLIDEQIALLAHLQNKGEADLLSASIDNFTRQNRYKEASAGIEESVKMGRSALNGFPAVNHGVTGCRQLIEALDSPLQILHGTPDARLLAEISIAGGFTSLEGGGISCNIPYAKSVSLEKTISDWQYVDRLTGLYQEAGVQINREPFAPLTGTLVPPCISHAVVILESILAAQQGVKNITVGYGQCGNLVQDVAALCTLQELTEEYLRKFGYKDVVISTVLHQWMGGFPQDEAKAFSVISWGSVAAALGHATKIVVRAPQESTGAPSAESTAQGLRCTRQMISMLSDQRLDAKSLAGEKAIISAETRCIVNKCLELGEGDMAAGIVRAFEVGVLDIPFAPSRFNAGKMLPARDNEGAVRILEAGSLPLTQDLLDANRQKIEERARFEKRTASFQMVIDDVYAISKGKLVGRPK